MKSIRIDQASYKELVLPLFDVQSQIRACEVLMYVTDLTGMEHGRLMAHFMEIIQKETDLRYIYRHYQNSLRTRFSLPPEFEIENDLVRYDE